MKTTNKSANGTSFHNIIVTATLTELKKVLGSPELGDGFKVNFEWVRETENGDVFTVYDWKEFRALDPNELIEWHIGGSSVLVTTDACEEINSLLVNLRSNPIPYGGSATVELNNGIIEDIWYTCYPSLKHQIKKIINIRP